MEPCTPFCCGTIISSPQRVLTGLDFHRGIVGRIGSSAETSSSFRSREGYAHGKLVGYGLIPSLAALALGGAAWHLRWKRKMASRGASLPLFGLRKGAHRSRPSMERVMCCAGSSSAGDTVTLALRQRLDELATLSGEPGGPQRWEKLGDCDILVPLGQFPWGIVFFLGGALLGQYPRLCYDNLLRTLADRTGCAVIAVPYETDTDHGALAKEADARFRKALNLAGERYGWTIDRMPVFGLGHSLGAKLQVIRHSTGVAGVQAEPLAVMAFNNFGLTDSLTLAKEALQAFQGGAAPPALDMVWNILQPMAEKAAQNAGLAFTPGPEDMENMMREGYTAANTRIITFGIDRLDCGEELSEAASERGTGPVVRRKLRGDHLTPVFFSVGDLAGAALKGKGAMGERAAAAAQQQSFAVGNQEELNDLVDELVSWVRPS